MFIYLYIYIYIWISKFAPLGVCSIVFGVCSFSAEVAQTPNATEQTCKSINPRENIISKCVSLGLGFWCPLRKKEQTPKTMEQTPDGTNLEIHDN